MVAHALQIDRDVRVPSAVFDHAGFRAWVKSPGFPDNLRATYAQGEVLLEMSPESLESHNKVKGEIGSVLLRIARDEDLGEVYVDGMLLTHEEAGVSTEPDAIFAGWPTLESGRLRPVEKSSRDDEYVELVGTPDLVVEIVSDSSERKDLELLRTGYAAAGVPEYWLVDARASDVRFEILSLSGGAYAARAPAGAPQQSDVLGRRFSLERSKNRMGRWTYMLHASR